MTISKKKIDALIDVNGLFKHFLNIALLKKSIPEPRDTKLHFFETFLKRAKLHFYEKKYLHFPKIFFDSNSKLEPREIVELIENHITHMKSLEKGYLRILAVNDINLDTILGNNKKSSNFFNTLILNPNLGAFNISFEYKVVSILSLCIDFVAGSLRKHDMTSLRPKLRPISARKK